MTARPWWDFEPCGTETAYWRHIGRSEEADQFCKDAHAAEERWRQRGAAVAAVLRRSHAEFTALRKGRRAGPHGAGGGRADLPAAGQAPPSP